MTLNYIYCDVFTHSNPEDLRVILNGGAGNIVITPIFLFAFAIVMEIPMAMILLSLLLPNRINRWANVIVPVPLVAIQLWSIFGTGASVTPHYVFFSAVEIATNAAIAVCAWVRLKPEARPGT